MCEQLFQIDENDFANIIPVTILRHVVYDWLNEANHIAHWTECLSKLLCNMSEKYNRDMAWWS